MCIRDRFLTDQHKIVFVHDKAAPKRKKSADDIVSAQLEKLGKAPASPFRI